MVHEENGNLSERGAIREAAIAIRQNWRTCRGACSARHRCIFDLEKARTEVKKRAAIYTRVSTADQHPETQLYDLREMAKQRGCEIVREYSDTISGAKSKRPGLDQVLADARRHRFDVVLVAAFDRVARSVRQ